MKSLYQKRIQKRTAILIVFFLIWFGTISFRLIQLQVLSHKRLKTIVSQQNQDKTEILPKRGTIYDRYGNILARSLPCPSVSYTPTENETQEVQYKRIRNLKKILNLTKEKIQTIKSRIDENRPFTWIKRKIDPATANQIKEMDLPGVSFQEESNRFYPQGSLAAYTLGRVDIDEIGQSGIEYRYNSILQGEKGERLNLRDAKRRGYRFETLKNPIPGEDLVLTIDETIQYYAARALKRAMVNSDAKWGTVIVSHPATGEILAMASCPEIDLNHPPKPVTLLDQNPAIHFTFESGSAFKIITASAALESGLVSPNDVFDCSPGTRQIANKTFRDHEKFEKLTFSEIIIHSSNVGTTYVGDKIGEELINTMIRNYGFGAITGIDLPAEENGLLHPMDDWSALSLPSLSIGYEVSVTATQMLQAVNIVANHGVLVPFQIVKNIPKDPSGYRRVISENTAKELTKMLGGVVREGTGIQAQINGYQVAGKTGTAQKFDPALGRYTSSAHLAVFVGFVPTDDPVLSMIIVIDQPQGKYYGGDVAAPVFKEIGTLVLRHQGIPQKIDLTQPIITAGLQSSEKE